MPEPAVQLLQQPEPTALGGAHTPDRFPCDLRHVRIPPLHFHRQYSLRRSASAAVRDTPRPARAPIALLDRRPLAETQGEGHAGLRYPDPEPAGDADHEPVDEE